MTLTRFSVGGRALCVDRGSVRGVLPGPALSGVPDAPDWIVGAYNHLGRAVAVIDLAGLLGLGLCPNPPAFILLVDAPSGLLALGCDAAPDEVKPTSNPRRGALLEVVDRGEDLLRIDLPLLEQRMEAELAPRDG